MEQEVDQVKESKGNRKRKLVALVIFAAMAVIGAVAAYFYVRYISTHITTEDAFVEGNIHVIAPKISGTVKAIHVKDNQYVKTGEVLIEIDEADYDARVQEAESILNAEKSKLSEALTQIEIAQRQLTELFSRRETARANLELQEANFRQAEADMKRAENLMKTETISKERFEKIKTGYDVALAQVKAAGEQVRQTGAAIETQKGLIRAAETAYQSQTSEVRRREATLRVASLNRSYTRLYAPADGYVTKKSVEIGNQLQAGQPLMAIVPLEGLYVTANYKETQLEKVKKGQGVTIKADTYPGKKFNGRVESIMAGTGSVFSLFPPENATGNYVKVVQRIPVKIVLEGETDPDHILRVGMSVVPTIVVSEK